MKKKLLSLIAILISVSVFSIDTLNIYYNKIHSNFDEKLFVEFEKKYNCKIIATEFPTAEKMLTHREDIISEKVDILWGLDQSNYYQIKNDTLFIDIPDDYLNQINNDYIFKRQKKMLPISADYLMFLFNKKSYKNIPKTFGQFQDIKFDNQFILCDVDETTIGRGMYFWSLSLFRTSGYRHFWRSMNKNVHSFSKNYIDAEKMFIAGEASVLLSTGSRATNLKKKYIFSEVIPEDGGFAIIYQIALPKTNNPLVEKFLSYILSPQTQKIIADEANLISLLKIFEDRIKKKGMPFFSKDKSLDLQEKVIAVDSKQFWLDFWKKLY